MEEEVVEAIFVDRIQVLQISELHHRNDDFYFSGLMMAKLV